MDLIYTNADRVDQGVLADYALDLSFGTDSSENDFEMTLGKAGANLGAKSFIYMEGTEYGGVVDAIRTSTDSASVVYMGRTWHGILNTKVIEPDSGEDYLVVSGDANDILSTLINRLGLSGLFTAVKTSSGINFSGYQFPRYCKGYDGIREMLEKKGAKLKIAWINRAVQLSAEPIVDYTANAVDGDSAKITIERHESKVNHLVCLGRGELAKREVIHLYVDKFGNIGDTQYFTGIEEVMDVYSNSNTDDLRSDGIARLKKLIDKDWAEMNSPESDRLAYDIGDIVGATDMQSQASFSSSVSQKIVRIKNGAIIIEYKMGS